MCWANNGGKGIRTPDIQLAKLALYQLSYAPRRKWKCQWVVFYCKWKSGFQPDPAGGHLDRRMK